MLRSLTLLLALAAPAAQACAVAEGCPMGEPPARSCAMVRLAQGFVCIDDPSNPAGFVIVPEGTMLPPGVPDCGEQVEDGCAMPSPGEVRPPVPGQAVGAGLAIPLLGLMVLLGVAAGR